MRIEPYAKYRATLRIRRDPRFGPIRPEMDALDGTSGVFEQLWKIQSNDQFANPAYYGEHAMKAPKEWPVSWVASGDLVDLEKLED